MQEDSTFYGDGTAGQTSTGAAGPGAVAGPDGRARNDPQTVIGADGSTPPDGVDNGTNDAGAGSTGSSGADDPAGGAFEPTGDAAVDAALRPLHGLESQPVREHAPVIEQVHQALQGRLAEEPPGDGALEAGA